LTVELPVVIVEELETTLIDELPILMTLKLATTLEVLLPLTYPPVLEITVFTLELPTVIVPSAIYEE
jgi:hypothetical protein